MTTARPTPTSRGSARRGRRCLRTSGRRSWRWCGRRTRDEIKGRLDEEFSALLALMHDVLLQLRFGGSHSRCCLAAAKRVPHVACLENDPEGMGVETGGAERAGIRQGAGESEHLLLQ
jgi:hypothetical protein